MSVHFSTGKNDWNTPADVLDLLDAFGPIALDPCSNATSLVNATVRVSLPDDGLAVAWSDRDGLVFVNPPYGRSIGQWVRKGLTADEIVMLVPARTDTEWWHASARHFDRIAFWRGRIRFHGAASGAPFPSAFLYSGPRAGLFEDVFREKAWVVG